MLCEVTMQTGKVVRAHQIFLAREMRGKLARNCFVQRRQIRFGRVRGLRDDLLQSCVVLVHDLDAKRMRRARRLRFLRGLICTCHAVAMTCATGRALTNVKLSRQLGAASARTGPIHRQAMANMSKANATDWAGMRMCPLFRHIGDEAVQRLAEKCRVSMVERGQVIFTQGDPADAFFVVLEGWVKLYRVTPGGAEAVVTVLTRGESFAEPVMFLGGRYPVIAEAASSGRLLRVEHAAFVQCLERESDLAVAMLASIGIRAGELTQQIGALKLLDAPRRVGEFFLRLLADSSQNGRIELPYEKVLIAARLGMTPESFSRALAALTKLGVTTKREIVSIADVQMLRDFVGLEARRYASTSQ